MIGCRQVFLPKFGGLCVRGGEICGDGFKPHRAKSRRISCDAYNRVALIAQAIGKVAANKTVCAKKDCARRGH